MINNLKLNKKFLDFILPIYEINKDKLKALLNSLEKQTSKDFNLIMAIDENDTDENKQKYKYLEDLLNSYSFDIKYYFSIRHGTFITEFLAIYRESVSDNVWIVNGDDEIYSNNAIEKLKSYEKKYNPDIICFGASKNYYTFSTKDPDDMVCEIVDKPNNLKILQRNTLYDIDDKNKFINPKFTSYYNEINKNSINRLIDSTLWSKLFKAKLFKSILDNNVIMPNYYGLLINGDDYLLNNLITPFIKYVLFIPDILYKFNYVGAERKYQKMASLSIPYDEKDFDNDLLEKAFKKEYSYLYTFQYLDQFVKYIMKIDDNENYIKNNYYIYTEDANLEKTLFDKIFEDKLTYVRMLKESYDTFPFLRDKIKKWLNEEPFIFLNKYMCDDILNYIKRQYG